MKAISLWQPWATLMATDLDPTMVGLSRRKAKGIETRNRPIRYRGEIAIHATPLGAIVCVGRLVAVRRTEDLRVVGSVAVGSWTWRLDEYEKAFGNYDDRRYGWLVADVVALKTPVTCRGYQMTPWDMPPEVEAAVRQQLGAAA